MLRHLLSAMPLLLLAKPKTEQPEADGAKPKEPPKDLGLTGAGVGAVTIEELDEALADYKIKRDARCAASKEEVPAKELVLSLFHKHAEQLADPKGVLRYKFQDDDEIKEVFIEPAKEKIKFGKKDANAEE